MVPAAVAELIIAPGMRLAPIRFATGRARPRLVCRIIAPEDAMPHDESPARPNDENPSGASTGGGLGHSKPQELFLPVHGYVELWPEELAVVDHPAFQRLRRVRQLGFAHFVFPGGTHTRFEHSIGALHVAQRIIDSINKNADGVAPPQTTSWCRQALGEDVARLVRVGALLHDIGHLPFGHTLEDELNHLDKHDGSGRLRLIGERRFPEYQADPALGPPPSSEGWSLIDLIEKLYGPIVGRLGMDVAPFEVIKQIICKAPTEGAAEQATWREIEAIVSSKIDLGVCRDIVGNTICADFLDYLFRDWHHLGKPLFEDKRLYQYMEICRPANGGPDKKTAFVVNVGHPEKVRHDAVTSVLELLEARYKLAETVLFHRTKLAIIGMFDRCLLEISDLHRLLGGKVDIFRSELERLLLDAADDDIADVLSRIARSGDAGSRLEKALADEAREINQAAGSGQPLLDRATSPTGQTRGPIRCQMDLIDALIARFRNRHVYTLAFKLRMSDLPSPQEPANPIVEHVVGMYRRPEDRLKYLRGVEMLCDLPAGSLVMYCPHDVKMNAKIARVKLLVDDEVIAFDEYEKRHKAEGLTCGALTAQIRRFYQLWCAQVFVDPVCWQALTKEQQLHLKSILGDFFSRTVRSEPVEVARLKIESSVRILRARNKMAARTARNATSDSIADDYIFPNGLPYRVPKFDD
jgi:HD superfamily phosphohydrolase